MSLYIAGPVKSCTSLSASQNSGLNISNSQIKINLDGSVVNCLSLNNNGLYGAPGIYPVRFVRYATTTTQGEFEYSTADSEAYSELSYILPTESIILGATMSAYSNNFIPSTTCPVVLSVTSSGTGVIFEGLIQKEPSADSAVVSFPTKPRINKGFALALNSDETQTFAEPTVFAYTIFILPIVSDPFLDLSSVLNLTNLLPIANATATAEDTASSCCNCTLLASNSRAKADQIPTTVVRQIAQPTTSRTATSYRIAKN